MDVQKLHTKPYILMQFPWERIVNTCAKYAQICANVRNPENCKMCTKICASMPKEQQFFFFKKKYVSEPKKSCFFLKKKWK